MIPILYPSDETAFNSNGLGRLYDCISCQVTEERNGIYECDFEYPVSGAHFDEIILGRIIAVEHDDTNDVQPFDIVSYSRPIDGVVTFHAQHISYRLSKIVSIAVVSGTLPIAGFFGAFTSTSAIYPSSMPFTFNTDISASGFCSAFDGVPKSVRSLLGGVEGSILDYFGGEYVWDKFNVTLMASRGVDRDMTVRYGLNLTEYNEDADYSESYNACVAYWTDGTTTVKTGQVSASLTSYSGRTEVMALDLSDKFESQPTTSQLSSKAQSYMTSNQVNLPAQSINVDFVNLKDTLEYADYAQLWTCQLCDTVNVVFPKYGMKGRFKVVKTVYDVLQERFTSMELGSLALTLSEALGLGG